MLGVVVLTWFVASAHCRSPKDTETAYLSGDYDAVISRFKDDESLDNALLTGLSYIAQQRYAEANLLFSRMPGEDAAASVVRSCGLLEMEIRLGRYDRAGNAHADCSTAVASNPGERSWILAYGLHTLGYMEHMNAAYEAATILYLQALDANPAVSDLEQYFELNTRNNLGNVYYRTGQSARALSTHREVHARRVRLLGPDHPKTGGSIGNLGNVYTAIGEYEKALYFHERAADISRRNAGPYDPEYAYSLNNIGLALVQLDRNQEAIDYLERSLSIKKVVQGDSSATLINTLANLTAAHIRLNQLEEASHHAELATRLAGIHQLTDSPGMWEFEIDRSKLLAVSSRIPDAINGLEKAWSSAVANKHPVSFRIANTLAELQLRTHNTDSARQYLDWIDACVRTCPWSPVSDSTLHEDPPVEESIRQWLQAHLLELSVPTAATAARAERAARTAERLQSPLWSLKFDRLWYTQAHGLYTGLTDLAVRASAVEDAWRHVESRKSLFVRRVQRERARTLGDTMSELMQVESELAIAEAGPSESNMVSDLIAERVQLQLAFERAAGTEDGPSDIHIPVGVPAIQERLAALDATFHHYFWSSPAPDSLRRLHAIVVSPDSVNLVALGTARQIEPAIAAFMEAIGAGNRSVVEQTSRRLSGLMLEPLLPLTTTPVLVVSPDDGLYNLPFELLSYDSGKPFSHLVERHAIVYAHSAGRLTGLSDWTVMAPGASMQIFDVPFTGASGSHPSRPASLPGAAREADALQRLMSIRPDIQVRRASNVEKGTFLRQATRATDIVHLATHSRFDPLTPHGSGILFKPGEASPASGVLTPAEMATRSLPVRLLVLSSCESARRTGGLSAAFDFSIALSMSGVEQALVSNWAVDDAATTEFMVRFYARMLDGESPPIALQRTKLSFAQEPALLSDPSIWAAFVLTIV